MTRKSQAAEAGPAARPRGARRFDPVAVDTFAAAALFAVAAAQIAFFHLLPYANDVGIMPGASSPPWAYAIAAACLLPIAVRRRWPGAVFAIVTVGMVVYSSQPWPPAVIAAGPVLASYTLAAAYGGRRTVPLVILVAVMTVGVTALAVSVSPAVVQAVGVLAMMTAAAFLGSAVRTQRLLLAEARRAQQEETRRRLDEERLRIAREIHDIMAHSLTLMTVQADAGLAALDDRPDLARDALAIVGDTGRATLRDLRSMLDVLTSPEDQSPRSPVPDIGAITALVDSVRETGMEASLEVTGDLDAVPPVVAVSTYRVVQESLTNAVRHSGGREVRVRIEASASDIGIQVTDDGTQGHAGSSGSGRGIRGMEERVSALGGEFEAGPRGEDGFRVYARIPYVKGAA